MNRTYRHLDLVYTLVSLGLLLCCSDALADKSEPRLQKILSDWQNRQSRFRAVEYKVEGIHKVPQGAYARKLPSEITGIKPGRVSPPHDVETPVNFTMLLDFDKGRHRRNIRESKFNLAAGKPVSLVMEDAFDGSKMRCRIPKANNPDLQVGVSQPEMTIVSGNMKYGQFQSNYFPIFFAHGRIYTATEPIIPGQLRNNPNPENLFIHGEAVYKERPCLIVRTQTLKMATTSFDEYWIDTHRESAILRYLSYSGEKVIQEIGIHYEKSYGHWLPDSWRYTAFHLGSMLSSEEMHVKQITINPLVQDTDFDLKVAPGMLVEERADLPTSSPIVWPKSELSVYKVKEDGGREEIADPFHRPGDRHQEHRSRQWLYVVFFTLIVAVSIVWIRHRKSTGQ